jgi:hypothetical protein
MTSKHKDAVLPEMKRMLGKAAADRIAGEGAGGRSRGRWRAAPIRVRLFATLAVAGLAAAAAVSAGALDRTPVAPQLGPEESGVKPGVEPGETVTVHTRGGAVQATVSPCIKSDPAGYSDAELANPEWCFHAPGRRGARPGSASAPPKNSTDLIVVDPVNADHLPVPGLRIEDQGTGICNSGSDSAGNLYRCSVGHWIYDPCWRDDENPSSPAVLCQAQPWDTGVIRIRLGDRGLDPVLGKPRDPGSGAPWGLQLASGERCVAVQGAHEVADSGRAIDYYCLTRAGKPDRRALMRGFDRSQPRWRVTSTTYEDRRGRLEPGPAIGVVKVWYAAQE